MKRIAIIVILFWAFSLSANPVISNIRVVQRKNDSKLVDIYYNLEHNRAVTIVLRVSDDNGLSWDMSCRLASGDIGLNIRPGRGKHIIWDVLTEHPNISGEEFRVRVIAYDVED